MGMAHVGNGQMLLGAGEEKDKKWMNCEYYMVDTESGATKKVTDAESGIYSIQLLSSEHTLALALEENRNVKLINYSTGKSKRLTTVGKY